jgi:hypothetical protein
MQDIVYKYVTQLQVADRLLVSGSKHDADLVYITGISKSRKSKNGLFTVHAEQSFKRKTTTSRITINNNPRKCKIIFNIGKPHELEIEGIEKRTTISPAEISKLINSAVIDRGHIMEELQWTNCGWFTKKMIDEHNNNYQKYHTHRREMQKKIKKTTIPEHELQVGKIYKVQTSSVKNPEFDYTVFLGSIKIKGREMFLSKKITRSEENRLLNYIGSFFKKEKVLDRRSIDTVLGCLTRHVQFYAGYYISVYDNYPEFTTTAVEGDDFASSANIDCGPRYTFYKRRYLALPEDDKFYDTNLFDYVDSKKLNKIFWVLNNPWFIARKHNILHSDIEPQAFKKVYAESRKRREKLLEGIQKESGVSDAT